MHPGFQMRGVLSACFRAKSLQSCPMFCNPMDYRARQVPLSMGFSKLESWSGLPFPPAENLPHLGVEFVSPALQVDSSPLSHWGSPFICIKMVSEGEQTVRPIHTVGPSKDHTSERGALENTHWPR